MRTNRRLIRFLYVKKGNRATLTSRRLLHNLALLLESAHETRAMFRYPPYFGLIEALPWVGDETIVPPVFRVEMRTGGSLVREDEVCLFCIPPGATDLVLAGNTLPTVEFARNVFALAENW